MQFKASVLAAVAGAALSNAQIQIPACGAPCIAQANLSCDPTSLACVCPQLNTLMGNQELITCVLGAGCTMNQLTDFISSMTSECAKFSAGGAASSAGGAVTSAVASATSAASSAVGAGSSIASSAGGVASSAVSSAAGGLSSATSRASSAASSVSGAISSAIPTTPVIATPVPLPSPIGGSNATNGTNPRPTNVPAAAARPEIGLAALGLGLMAVLAL